MILFISVHCVNSNSKSLRKIAIHIHVNEETSLSLSLNVAHFTLVLWRMLMLAYLHKDVMDVQLRLCPYSSYVMKLLTSYNFGIDFPKYIVSIKSIKEVLRKI